MRSEYDRSARADRHSLKKLCGLYELCANPDFGSDIIQHGYKSYMEIHVNDLKREGLLVISPR